MPDTEVEDKETLYEQIVELTNLLYEDDKFDSVDAYKTELVRHFAEMSEEDFEGLSGGVADWVNAATEVVKKNQGARKKSALPILEGLEQAEVPKKRGRKPGVKAEKKEKVPKEKAERGPNRYLRAFRELHKNPEMLVAELAAATEVSENAAKYCVEAFNAAMVSFTEAGYEKV